MTNIVKARETLNQQRYISTHREQIMTILSLDEQLHVTPTVILKKKSLSYVCYPQVFPHGTKCLWYIHNCADE